MTKEQITAEGIYSTEALKFAHGIKAGNVRGLIPQESVYVDYAKQVVHNKVNDATYTAVEHLLGRQGAVEVTVLSGYYTMLGLSMMALGVELEEGVENLLP